MPFIRIFGLINAFVVENVRQQRELERHEHVSAIISSEGGLVHRVLASRFAKDMGFADGELPALEGGAQASDNDFGADALPIHSGEIYKMATYVAGGDPREDIEVIVQRWVARRFTPRYEPSASVRDAARLIGGWHRRGPLTALACIFGGRLNDAKTLVSASVPPDLHIAYAPTVLLPYIVKCLERMRQFAEDPSISESLSAEMVVAGSLTPPRFVFRTCKQAVDVSFSKKPIPADTLVILPARRLGAAGDGSSAFGSEDASRYPAIRLIRRLLTRVWIASREVHHPSSQSAHSITQRALVQRGAIQRVATQPIEIRRVVARQQAMIEQVTAIQSAAADAAAREIGAMLTGAPPALPSGEPQPAAMEAAAVERKVLQPKFELASLTRTLPFGNDLGRQRRRRKNSERRAERRRAAKAKSDRTVPGPF